MIHLYFICEAYLRAKQKGRGDYNILCLDYGDLALTGPVPGDPIPSVRKRYEYVCDIVSEKAVRLILALEENGYASSFNSIHIVGHSLGGQVSGYIGRKIQEKTGKIIGRITGKSNRKMANLVFCRSCCGYKVRLKCF